jgi:hypothetical protein
MIFLLIQGQMVSDYAAEIFEEAMSEAGKYTVTLINTIYYVKLAAQFTTNSGEKNDGRRVSKDLQYCSCHRSQKIPCRHIIAVVNHQGNSHQLLHPNTIEQFFHPCFTVKGLCRAYSVTTEQYVEADLQKSNLFPVTPTDIKLRKNNTTHFKRKQSKSARNLGINKGVKPSKRRQCGMCGSTEHMSNGCQFGILSQLDRESLIHSRIITQNTTSSSSSVHFSYDDYLGVSQNIEGVNTQVASASQDGSDEEYTEWSDEDDSEEEEIVGDVADCDLNALFE